MLVKLKDVCTFESNNFNKKDNWTFVNYLDTSNLTENVIQDFQYLEDLDNLPSRAKRKVKIGDILFSSVRPNQKHYGFIDKEYPNLLVSTGFIVLTPTEKVNNKFLYYWLIQDKTIDILQTKAETSTSAYPSITKEDMYDLEIDLPPLEIQDKIANILSNIDNQIGRNNAITKRLQVLAQTTYSRWFNQFEFPDNEGKPYKSNGGELVYNKELGKEIPKDWAIDNLYKIASFENGLACQKFRPLNDIDKLPVIKITEMHNGFTKETEFCRNNVAKKHIINNGDLLFSWSATLETQIWCGGKGVLNQHIFNVIPKEYFSKYYVYLQLTSYIQNFVKIAESRKTTMGHITTDHLKQSKIVIPPNAIMNKFTALINPIYLEIINLNIENIKLIELKERLLPLLINGQLNI